MGLGELDSGRTAFRYSPVSKPFRPINFLNFLNRSKPKPRIGKLCGADGRSLCGMARSGARQRTKGHGQSPKF